MTHITVVPINYCIMQFMHTILSELKIGKTQNYSVVKTP